MILNYGIDKRGRKVYLLHELFCAVLIKYPKKMLWLFDESTSRFPAIIRNLFNVLQTEI